MPVFFTILPRALGNYHAGKEAAACLLLQMARDSGWVAVDAEDLFEIDKGMTATDFAQKCAVAIAEEFGSSNDSSGFNPDAEVILLGVDSFRAHPDQDVMEFSKMVGCEIFRAVSNRNGEAWKGPCVSSRCRTYATMALYTSHGPDVHKQVYHPDGNRG